MRQRVNRLATSAKLGHLLGVNGLFVDLAAHARTTGRAELPVWWSELTCRQVTGGLVRPDGHGVWIETGGMVSFWLEWDQGTEQAHRVVSRLDGYVDLHRATGLDHWCWSGHPPQARRNR